MPEEKSLPKSDPTPLPNASSEPHPLESHTPIKHEDPHHKHHLLKYFLIGMFFAFAVVAILVAYYLGMNKSNSKQQTAQIVPSPAEEVACTMDVKECPDGSFVSRQGPACEFAECPEKASNVNTYSNTKYNFSFDYPSEWEIVTSRPGSSDNTVSLSPIDIPNTEGSSPPIRAEYYDNPNNLSIQKWEEEKDKDVQISRGFYISDAKKTTLNGYTAYSSEKGNCHPFLCPQVIIVGDKKIIIFQHLGKLSDPLPSQDTEIYKDVFEEIYTSFKFN